MIEELRHVFDDIRNSIIEMGVDVDECVSPEEYAYRIKLINGNNAVTCIPVFKSSAEKPETPTKVMSSNNPTDYPYGWSTPDELTDDIWMTYTIVGPEKVYVPWTTPVLIYSTGSSSPQPRIEPGSTRIFLIYAEWPDRDVELDIPQGGHWNVEENTLDGPVTSIVRKNNTATGDVVYWNDNNVHEAGSFTWLSTGTFLASDGNLVGEWSDPVCINYAKDGKDGRNGVDGDNTEFIYKLFHNIDELNHTSTPYSNPDVDDYIPDGWTDSPLAIDPDVYLVEGMCTRKRNKTTKKWGNFTPPIAWAVWGQDGTDGDGVEYIFLIASSDQCRQNDDGSWTLVDQLAFPPMSKTQFLDITRVKGIEDDIALQAYQIDEFIPGDYPVPQSLGWDRNWTDDPSDVSENEPLEFVSIRKYRKNPDTGESEWGWYSEPKLWNKWAYVDTSIFTAFAFTRTNENLLALDPPLVIEGGEEDDPIPDNSTYTKDGHQVTVVWNDSVPNGTQTVWMTKRVFGQPNSTWTSPIRMADTTDFQVEYSASVLSDGTSTQLPSLNDYINESAEGVDEAQWRADCIAQGKGTWNDTVTDPLWMATCTRNNGSWTDWTIAKVRGENAIRVDLTNDKDELIYDHDGRKVSLRNSETNANLYDGATEVTSDVTWSISKVTGVNRYNSGTAIQEFPANPAANTAYITTDGDVLVTGITAGNEAAVVRIKAAYHGGNYYKEFTVGKKVGEDNYYLDFTPSVITYNKTTNTPSSATLNVVVKKESYIDGKITVADAMPTGYKVFLYNSTIDQNWTDVNHDATINLNANSRDLKLLLATAKTGGTIEDGPEDIPVIIVSDGEDGEVGRGIVSVANYYMWYNNGTSHPAESASGWSASIPAAPSDETYKYLWKKIVTTYNKAPLTETTYELVSERGLRGPIGARMRMRNWSTDYSYPDPDGQSGWQCGNNPNDAFYDIAIWPNTEDISITGVTDDPSKLWRCIKNLDYSQVTPGSTPEDYPLNFTQAVGWDFIATKLLLAQRISADQIDARGISVDVLVTTPDEDGGYIDIRGNRMLMKNGTTEVCKITGDELELSADHNSQYAWGERLGYDFAEAFPGSSSTFGAHFERPIGRITVPQTAGTQTDYFASDHKQHIGLRIEGTANTTGNFAPGENICGMSIFIKATNVNTGQVIQWHTGGYAEQGALPYKDSTSAIHFNEGELTLLGYDFELDTTEHKTLSPGTYDITITGDGWGPVLRDHHNQRIVLSQYQSIKNGNPVPPANWQNYEGFFSPIIWHHTSVNGAQTTEIAADGFGHILDADNYFYVRHLKENNVDTNTLMLEFLSNGTFGLQISKNGIKYTKTGPDPQNWIDLV